MSTSAKKLAAAGTLTVLLALAAVIVLSSSSSSGGSPQAGDRTPAQVARGTQALLAGVPTDGNVAGYPGAEARLIEYGDLQCPYCREFATETMPFLVERYVRTRQLQVELRLLASVGPESRLAAAGAYAAGEQGQFWPYVESFYAAQGRENTGYVTPEFLGRIVTGVPHLDFVAWAHALKDNHREYEARTTADEAAAVRAEIAGTPAFVLQAGDRSVPLQLDGLGPADLEAALADAGIAAVSG